MLLVLTCCGKKSHSQCTVILGRGIGAHVLGGEIPLEEKISAFSFNLLRKE